MTMKITHLYSETAGNRPQAENVDVGQLWINTGDATMGTKKQDGTLVTFAQLSEEEKQAALNAIPKTGQVAGVTVSAVAGNTGTDAATIDDDSDTVLAGILTANPFVVTANKTTAHKTTKLVLTKPQGVTSSVTWNGVDLWLIGDKAPQFGDTEDEQELCVAIFTSPTKVAVNVVYNTEHPTEVEGGGAGTWGEIEGTLSNQTDLQNALNAKADARALTSAVENASATFAPKVDAALTGTATLNGNNIATVDQIPDVSGFATKTELTGYVPVIGGTLTGALNVVEPTEDANAASKGYVDSEINSLNITQYATTSALTTGLATKANTEDLNDYLPIAGGTLTGALSVLAPTENAHAANKQYVDNQITALNIGQYATTTALNEGLAEKADNADLVDLMPKSGGTFTGEVNVQDPTSASNPATKEYVDAEIADLNISQYATTISVTSGLATKANTADPTFTGTVTVPNPSVNGAAANKQYVDTAIADLDISQYATTEALTSGLAEKADTSDLTSGLAQKANVSDLNSYMPKTGGAFTGAITVQNPTANNNPATKQYVDNAVASVYKYKGSVANEAALPSSNQTVGDVYNVEDTGDNFAWTGTDWDKLAGTVDLSNYATVAQVNAKADDDEVVKLTGNQTVGGIKTFTNSIVNNANPLIQSNRLSVSVADTPEDRTSTVQKILAQAVDSNGLRLISLETTFSSTRRRAMSINGRNATDDGWVMIATFSEDFDGNCTLQLANNPDAEEDSTIAATTAWVRDTIASLVPDIKVSNATLADRATQLANSRNITLTGDVTGSASFNGTANASIASTLTNSGVTAGAYGPTAAATLAFGGSVNVPQITVDAKGRATAVVNRAITLPAAPTSVSGNAGTATRLATARTISLTGDATGSASFNGSANAEIDVTVSHADAADTATSATSATTATRLSANKTFSLTGAVTGSVSSNLSGNVSIATTYTAMTGATSSAAGTMGAVPAPAAGYNGRFLRGDGTWQTPTDNKMQQNASTSNAEYPMLAKSTTATANINGQAIFDADVTINPSLGRISANKYVGATTTTTYVGGATQGGSILEDSENAGGDFSSFIRYKSTNGAFTLTGYQSYFEVNYVNDDNIESGTNTTSAKLRFSEAGVLTATGGFSGDLSGNATTATTLATTRTFRVNLASTSTANFNGSGNCTPGVTGTLPIANGGTGATSAAAARTALGALATSGGTVSGNLTVTGTLSGGTLSATSDLRLKDVKGSVEDIDLSSISSYRYIFKNDEEGKVHIGLIAQDVQKVVPEAVKVIDEEGHLGIEYNAIVALLVDKINRLEERIAQLEDATYSSIGE